MGEGSLVASPCVPFGHTTGGGRFDLSTTFVTLLYPRLGSTEGSSTRQISCQSPGVMISLGTLCGSCWTTRGCVSYRPSTWIHKAALTCQ